MLTTVLDTASQGPQQPWWVLGQHQTLQPARSKSRSPRAADDLFQAPLEPAPQMTQPNETEVEGELKDTEMERNEGNREEPADDEKGGKHEEGK